jgi:hypothetical protein
LNQILESQHNRVGNEVIIEKLDELAKRCHRFEKFMEEMRDMHAVNECRIADLEVHSADTSMKFAIQDSIQRERQNMKLGTSGPL